MRFLSVERYSLWLNGSAQESDNLPERPAF
jgi:hypothetical protein